MPIFCKSNMRNSNTFLKDMWKKLCWHWNYPQRMILSKQDTLKRRKIIPSMSLDLLILFFSEFLLKITFLRFWQKTANFRLSKYVLLKNVPKRPAKLLQLFFLVRALTDQFKFTKWQDLGKEQTPKLAFFRKWCFTR